MSGVHIKRRNLHTETRHAQMEGDMKKHWEKSHLQAIKGRPETEPSFTALRGKKKLLIISFQTFSLQNCETINFCLVFRFVVLNYGSYSKLIYPYYFSIRGLVTNCHNRFLFSSKALSHILMNFFLPEFLLCLYFLLSDDHLFNFVLYFKRLFPLDVYDANFILNSDSPFSVCLLNFHVKIVNKNTAM